MCHLKLGGTHAVNLAYNVGQLPLLLVEEASFVEASLAVLEHLILLHTFASLFICLKQVEGLLWHLIVDAINFARS